MTYEEATAFMEGLIDFERAARGVSGFQQRIFKLDRMRVLLERLGNPHAGLRYVHVAGTKGKGSVCAFVESVLRASGYRVGLYTQPGLVDPRERVMIDRRMIPKPLFVRQVERLRPCVEQVDPAEHGEVTYFEGMTALALDHFAIEKTDYVVLEVGLGGRLDATNVVTPAVCAITALGFDHAHILGHTLEKIAGEKAGIVKPGAPVVSSPQAEEAMEVLRSVCREQATRLVEVGRDVRWEVRSLGDDRQVFDLWVMGRTIRGLEIGMTGAHQLSNAAVAAGVLELLSEAGARIPDASLREGLSRTRWPGRMQVVGRSPTVILDGAHTIESARSLVQALREGYRYRRLILVFGIAADKDISGVWRALEREADVAYLTRSTFPKAAEPRSVHRMIDDSEVALHVVENGVEAFERARAEAGPDDLICVTGSFYLIGDIMRHLGIAAQEEA